MEKKSWLDKIGSSPYYKAYTNHNFKSTELSNFNKYYNIEHRRNNI